MLELPSNLDCAFDASRPRDLARFSRSCSAIFAPPLLNLDTYLARVTRDQASWLPDCGSDHCTATNMSSI
jgi:hypothetical protein